MISTKTQADALARNRIHSLQLKRIKDELGDIKALVAASVRAPIQAPDRFQATQDVEMFSKQKPTKTKRSLRLVDEIQAVQALETNQSPSAITTSTAVVPTAVTGAAKTPPRRNVPLCLSQRIDVGDKTMEAEQYIKAEEIYGTILQEAKSSGYRDTSKEVDVQLYGLQSSWGKALLLSGKVAQAELVLEKTLKSTTEQLGEDHEPTLRTRLNFASCKCMREKWRVGIRLCAETLHALERFRGDDHDLFCRARCLLAWMYDHAGDVEKAKEYYKLAIAFNIQARGPAHEMTISSLVKIAEYFQKHGLYKEVTESFRCTLAPRERVKTAQEEQSVEDVVDVLRLLAKTLKSKGKLQEALLTRDRAIALAAAIPQPVVHHEDEDTFWVLVAEYLYSKEQFRGSENIWRGLWIQQREIGSPTQVTARRAMEKVVACLQHQDLLRDGKFLVADALKTRSAEECNILKVIVAVHRHLNRSQVQTRDRTRMGNTPVMVTNG